MPDTTASKHAWRERLSSFAPLFVWVGVVFVLSSPTGAAEETSRIIKPIIEFFIPNASRDTVLIIHSLIRKAAHLTEYSVLGFFGVRAFVGTRSLGSHRFFAALVLVAIVAALDEFNQSFEPSRTGAISDVLLDICGGIIMIFALIVTKRPKSVDL
jgi:VanZ family protein